jgi:hypothetical protein
MDVLHLREESTHVVDGERLLLLEERRLRRWVGRRRT